MRPGVLSLRCGRIATASAMRLCAREVEQRGMMWAVNAWCKESATDSPVRGRCAEYLRLLREKEKAAGLSGDDDIDAFLKASALQGKRHSVVTEYILKLLGLDVSTPPSGSTPWASALQSLHSTHVAVVLCARCPGAVADP